MCYTIYLQNKGNYFTTLFAINDKIQRVYILWLIIKNFNINKYNQLRDYV